MEIVISARQKVFLTVGQERSIESSGGSGGGNTTKHSKQRQRLHGYEIAIEVMTCGPSARVYGESGTTFSPSLELTSACKHNISGKVSGGVKTMTSVDGKFLHSRDTYNVGLATIAISTFQSNHSTVSDIRGCQPQSEWDQMNPGQE